MNKFQLTIDSTVIALAAFAIALIFSGCTSPQIDAANQRLVAAERVAYAACLARQKAPIVATALRDSLAGMVPGADVAHGIIAGSCDIILANPGTTVTLTGGAH